MVTCWDHLLTLSEKKLIRPALERFETEVLNIAQEEYDKLDWQDIGTGVPVSDETESDETESDETENDGTKSDGTESDELESETVKRATA